MFTGNQSGYGSGQSGYGGNQVDYPQRGHHQGHHQGHPQGQQGSYGSSGPAQSVGMANQEGGMDKQLGTHHQQHQGQQQGQQGGGYSWGQGLGSGFGTGFHDSRQVSLASSHLCPCVPAKLGNTASACWVVHTHVPVVYPCPYKMGGAGDDHRASLCT